MLDARKVIAPRNSRSYGHQAWGKCGENSSKWPKCSCKSPFTLRSEFWCSPFLQVFSLGLPATIPGTPAILRARRALVFVSLTLGKCRIAALLWPNLTAAVGGVVMSTWLLVHTCLISDYTESCRGRIEYVCIRQGDFCCWALDVGEVNGDGTVALMIETM